MVTTTWEGETFTVKYWWEDYKLRTEATVEGETVITLVN